MKVNTNTLASANTSPLGITWLFLLLNLCQGQYVPKSQGLTNYQSAITFVKESADFWKTSQDPLHGGFFTDVDRMGNAIDAINGSKTILTQSRHAFGFAKAFMLTGDETYLDLARNALDFQYAHFWDATNDGWIVETARDGTPTSSGSNQSK